MEIKSYVGIAWRRLWLIVALPAAVLVLGLLRSTPRPSGYAAHMRFSVGLVPEAQSANYTYDRYYTWLTAEYLVDDLSEVVKSQEIAEAASAEAARQGLAVHVPPGAIQSATGAGKQHRILSISLGWPDAGELTVLANALATVLRQGQAPYFEHFRTAGTPIVMELIDPPSVSAIGPSLRTRLELPLRLSLALLAGVALAFVLEYLDDTVHGPQDLQALGLDVVGHIPRPGIFPWGERRVR